ncbi:hypothetical protein [Streptomyces hiroshimensis]|uniref:Uncharacterized protein n=1 Tax=Streptomyces hiroshimensis TaxID=66424 RepID=A0ABQ2Y828_9ACTN|nr:hypothetical protein [Streptomyces hiroshimensis]GGX68701.1 hypothetical protein GCM10010324_11890 [Streptomyces hiroshimensis]
MRSFRVSGSLLGKRWARLLLCGAVVLLAAGAYGAGTWMDAAAGRLWNGEPYPAADPDQVAVRLKGQAQRVYEEVALPGRPDVGSDGVGTGTCYYRGLRSIGHIDQGLPGVSSFVLEWRVTDTSRDIARAGQERVRRRLEQQGWKFAMENVGSDMGFRYEDPETGDHVDVDWHQPTGTLAVRIFTPCGKVPQGFDEYAWPASAWSPQ